MRYKTTVSNKLDTIHMKLKYLMRGLEEKRFSPQDILQIVKEANDVTEQTIDLIDQEKEEFVAL